MGGEVFDDLPRFYEVFIGKMRVLGGSGGKLGVSWGEEFFIEKFGGCSLSGAAARTGNLSKKEKGKWKNKEHVEFYQE